MGKKLRKNKRDGVRSLTKTVGFGYVGRWENGSGGPGWFLPSHLTGYTQSNEPPHEDAALFASEPFVLCRITVEQVFGVDGRAITRKVRREKA